jgi:fatty acid amide hydrolase
LPAFKHGTFIDLPMASSYCMLPNLWGVPAGVVAATRVRPGEETDRPESYDKVQRAAWNVELGSTGLPVGVQVAARHWREDIVLSLMSALEQHFRQQADYPERP